MQVQQSLTAAAETQQSLQSQVQQQAQHASVLLSTLQQCFGFDKELQGILQSAQGEVHASALQDLLTMVSFVMYIIAQSHACSYIQP